MFQFVAKYRKSRRATVYMTALSLAAVVIMALGNGCSQSPILIHDCVDAGAQDGGGGGGAGGALPTCK
jgi:hypothetical protein